jgi:hypothetical protein
MKFCNARLGLLGFGLLFIAATPASSLAGPFDKPASDKLSGEAIKAAWFTGQPFIATAPDGSAYKFVFQADGHATKAQTAKKGPVVSGFWRVIAEGYCVRWTGSVREKCFNIRKEGDKTVARFGAVIVANWTR